VKYSHKAFFSRVFNFIGRLLFFSDDIIRRKLLIDGDGGDADKGLVRLQKFIIEWCSEETEPSDEINRETLVSGWNGIGCGLEFDRN